MLYTKYVSYNTSTDFLVRNRKRFLQNVVSSRLIPVCTINGSEQTLGISENCWKLTYLEHSKFGHFRPRKQRMLSACSQDAVRTH